jgi:hypothetical protein
VFGQKVRAEIIPVEPDPDNTGEGNEPKTFMAISALPKTGKGFFFF